MQSVQQQPSRRERIFALAGWVTFIARAFAVSVEVIMRRRFGQRYLGAQAALAILVILIFSTFWRGRDVQPLMVFLGLYLLMCGVRRRECIRRRRRGDTEHSFYSGSPDVMRWPVFKRISERKAKGVVEPLLVFLFGVLLLPVSEPLGTYLICAALSLVISFQLARGYEQTRLLDMRDAFLDQRNLAERFRGGDWRNQ